MAKLDSHQSIDLTIIIPTYNRLWCLPQAVESCLSDRLGVEVVVVDDGSTDGTWEWLQQQADVIAIRQANWGKDTAVNLGFSRSRGRYVRFLDSDDFILPEANRRQIAIARNTNADIVVSGLQMLNHDTGQKTDVPWQSNDDFISQQLGESRSCHYSAFLFKRDFIADIPHRQEFGPVDDRMFVIEAALKDPKVSIDDGLAFVLRDHQNSRLTNARNIHWLIGTYQHITVYKKAYQRLQETGRATPRRKKAIAGIMWHAAHRIAAWSLRDGCELMNWIHELDPNISPPVTGNLALAYKQLGFKRTEQLIRFVRYARSPFM